MVGINKGILRGMRTRCPHCAIPFDPSEIVEEVFARIGDFLHQKVDVRVQGFGTFSARFVQSQRFAFFASLHNTDPIYGRLVIRFKPNRLLKQAVNKGLDVEEERRRLNESQHPAKKTAAPKKRSRPARAAKPKRSAPVVELPDVDVDNELVIPKPSPKPEPRAAGPRAAPAQRTRRPRRAIAAPEPPL